ncbi:uncharacterized protein LOC131188495 [Ahaetulla prasina]|uniref:uncharacterized protein LOC131188495 n=1 Tax=Ahaetulla prasina TaxID=499056 RepID=UPI00264879FA|nr:uncharacterized protein LOC131188495 [Ahaetulla prasina]
MFWPPEPSAYPIFTKIASIFGLRSTSGGRGGQKCNTQTVRVAKSRPEFIQRRTKIFTHFFGGEVRLIRWIIRWIMEKAREFQKNIYFCFIDYAKAFDCVDHNKLWQVLKEMGVPDHLICLLRNLYAGQEATVRTGHGTTDWFKIGKGVRQGCILSLCLFNLYAEHIMRKAGLDESKIGIKIAGRNINNLRYADDTTLMAESEEELKSLLMRVKEESAKVGLKLNIKKTKIMASVPFNSWQINGEEMEVVTDFIFLGSKITADGDCSQEIKSRLLLGRKAMANLDSVLKSRDITLPTKVHIVKAMVFPVAMYGCEGWTIRKDDAASTTMKRSRANKQDHITICAF